MSSSFPTTLDAWSDRTDDVHDVLADDVNFAHHRVIATEQVVGISGATRGASNHEGRLKAVEAATTVSTTAPVSPVTGDRWLDTSGDPYLWKAWDGADWLEVGATSGSTDAESLQGTLIDTGLSPADGDLLAWNASTAQWESATPASGASFATPALVLGSAAAAGAAASVIRSDSTIAAFDATAPSTQAIGDSAVVGVAAFAARRDHKHALPAFGTTAGTVAQGSDSRFTDARTPTGAAGGDLNGTYPNPRVSYVSLAKWATD